MTAPDTLAALGATLDGAALLELAGSGSDLTALSVTMGRLAAEAMMRAEADRLVSAGGAAGSGSLVRYGTTTGRVYIGGQAVPVTRPRVRDRNAGREITLSTYAAYADRSPLVDATRRRALAGVSTRDYAATLDMADARGAVSGASRSAVSRRLSASMAADLDTLTTRRLDGVRLAALMLDGMGVGGHTVVVAVGITEDGRKILLGQADGPTESKRVVIALLRNLLGRGLDVSRGVLVVLDGGKALRTGVRAVLGRAALIQRCREHKVRNVLERVPVRARAALGNRLRNAWALPDYASARAALLRIAAELDGARPAAAASLREGLDDTLTLQRLGVQAGLGATLGSTNAIESVISIARHAARNVKRWTTLGMRLRWTAAGLLEAERRVIVVRGARHLGALVDALGRAVARRARVHVRRSSARPGSRVGRVAVTRPDVARRVDDGASATRRPDGWVSAWRGGGGPAGRRRAAGRTSGLRGGSR